MKKLSDNEIGNLLHRIRLTLKAHEGHTIHGDTALKASDRALGTLQLGLLMASEGITSLDGPEPRSDEPSPSSPETRPRQSRPSPPAPLRKKP